MALVVRSGDLAATHKCWLFVAQSLMQRGKLKTARTIVSKVFKANKDLRVANMCKGVWARLMHSYKKKKTTVHL